MYERAVDSVRIATLTKGCFDTVSIRAGDDLMGENGRSKTRNDLARDSDADWLFFLDADDLMDPDALEAFSYALDDEDAVFGQICELKDGCVHPRYQVPIIHSKKELIAFDPYMTLQMGHFVRREVFNEIQFDESMDVGEDWDYYLKLWDKYKCKKVGFTFMINDRGKHSTGPRSGTGRQWTEVVHRMLEKAREG